MTLRQGTKWIAVLALTALAGCGGGGSSAPPPADNALVWGSGTWGDGEFSSNVAP